MIMIMKKRVRISKGGRISIPAAIRRRWATSTVALEDQGDRVVLEPALADAVLIGSANPDDRIATADPDVLAVANAEKLESVALPGQV